MDRGIPTEETLTQMRQSDPPVSYRVGTPKGRLSQLEAALAQAALAAGAGGRHGQAAAPGGGMLRFCAERRAHRQGAGDAPAPTQAPVEAVARVAPNEDPGPGWALDEAGCCAPAMAHGLAVGSPTRAQERGAD